MKAARNPYAFQRRLGVVPILLAASLLLGAAPQSGSRVVLVIGTVEIGSGEPPQWRPAAEGDLLRPGDVVRTGANGRVELRIAAGTVRLYEHSLMRIPLVETDQSVELEDGASLFDILKQNRNRPFEVKTPEAVVMVKGTRFSVSLEGSGAAVSVFRGLVGVRGMLDSAAREVLVHEGFTAAGAHDIPFTLDLIRSGADAWNTWSKRGERPKMRDEARNRLVNEPTLDATRTVTRAAMAERMAEHLGDYQMGEGMPGDDSYQMHHDPIADSPDDSMTEEVVEHYTEETLGGGDQFNVELINLGGPNYVHITGPSSLDQTLDEAQLQAVLEGNSALFSPELTTFLNTQSISPELFAEQLLQMF